MFDKLESLKKKYEELQQKLYSPEVTSDVKKTVEISKQLSELEEVYNLYKQRKKADSEVKEAKEILENEDDEEMIQIAKEQLQQAIKQKEELEWKLKIALLPKDENDDKNIYMEIRPAAWGDESALFAEELMRMYMRYAEKQGWKVSIEDIQYNDIWWIKFAMIKIVWNKVYSKLKYESWVHRVQRVPKTESQWRIHTSTVTVAILPEVEEIVDYDLDLNEVEIDFYAASSAWWQHANRNKTWVRLRHKPTWIIVSVWDSRSQLQNKEKAFNILKARLLQMEKEKQAEEERQKRLYQVWTGDRSEKIRTYNFPQDRVTDHRIKKSYSNLSAILDWEIDEIINDLIVEDQARLMKN